MSTGVLRVRLDVESLRQQLRQGFYNVDLAKASQNAQWLPLAIANNTTVEVIGGVAPRAPDLTTCTTFGLFDNDQDLLVAFEGTDASSEAITVTTTQPAVLLTGVTITQLTIRNESGSAATCVVMVDGE